MTLPLARNMTDYREKSAYGPGKRMRRGLLRGVGLWRRRDYDVRFVYVDRELAYKKVLFNHSHRARAVAEALRDYGPSQHFPGVAGRDGRALWLDYVPGRSCHEMNEAHMPELATFYGDVYRRSRLTSQQTTLYWRQLQDNLRFLYERAVICDALHSRLHTQAQAVMPERLRIGFDYADPIGANLVQRTDNASICAVDVKNLRVDSLVGLGLAKASHRWLSPARRPALFDHLQRLQLGDIREAFPFLVFYETTQRICRRMDQGERLLKRVRSNDTKRAALVRLLDSYNGLAPITVQQPHATVDGA